jgi:hypothetical protein
MTMPIKNEAKVVEAFEILDKIGKKDTLKIIPPEPDAGIRIHFGIEARDPENKPLKPIHIDFIIPFVRQIPIIGKTVLKTIRYLQAKQSS